MARRRGRGLSEEERALWSQVAGTARPLEPARRAPLAPPPAPTSPPVPPAAQPAAPPTAPLSLLVPVRPSGPRNSVALLAEPVTPLGPAVPGLDRRTAERLRKGRREPEARLDLHGHTLDRAHGELAGFIRRAQDRGLRCVLVITGKGRPRERESAEGWRLSAGGVLRDSVPRWLSLPPLGALVVGVFPAHAKHGGGGAFYVYLRRSMR